MPDPAMATVRCARRREQPRWTCCGAAGAAGVRRRSARRERREEHARDPGAAAILCLAAAVGGRRGRARLESSSRPGGGSGSRGRMMRAAAATGWTTGQLGEGASGQGRGAGQEGARASGGRASGVGEGQRPVRGSAATTFCMATLRLIGPRDRAPKATTTFRAERRYPGRRWAGPAGAGGRQAASAGSMAYTCKVDGQAFRRYGCREMCLYLWFFFCTLFLVRASSPMNPSQDRDVRCCKLITVVTTNKANFWACAVS